MTLDGNRVIAWDCLGELMGATGTNERAVTSNTSAVDTGNLSSPLIPMGDDRFLPEDPAIGGNRGWDVAFWGDGFGFTPDEKG